jgi:hypothetical protein
LSCSWLTFLLCSRPSLLAYNYAVAYTIADPVTKAPTAAGLALAAALAAAAAGQAPPLVLPVLLACCNAPVVTDFSQGGWMGTSGVESSVHARLYCRLQPARRCAHACACSHAISPNPLCFDCADCVYLCSPCPAVDCVASCELQLSGMSADVISREFELVPAAERAAVYPSGSVGRLRLTLVASQALKTLLQHVGA